MSRPGPRKPWDIGWVLQGDQVRERQDSLDLPPVGWGSPRVTKDTLLDRWHQLNGTWRQDHSGAEEGGQPRGSDSAFHSLADLEASGEPADLPTTSPEVEPSRQYTDPAFSNRPTSRTVILTRPSRIVRERPGAQTVLVPMIYAPVFCQPRPSSTLWARQTPVSGGTGLRVTTDCPQTSTGWYDEFSREVGRQSRRGSPTQDWPELRGGETPREGCPQGGSAGAGPRSTGTRFTYPPRPGSSVWEEELTSWGTSPGLVTQARLKSESHW